MKLPPAFIKLLLKAEAQALTNPAYAGQVGHSLRSPLDSACRTYVGRMRYIYICSAEKEEARGLYVGIRAENETRDAYKEFEQLLRKGAFDDDYRDLGLSHPFMVDDSEADDSPVSAAEPA